MGWMKAMKVEKFLREKIAGRLLGQGKCFEEARPYCMVGWGLDALGMTQESFKSLVEGDGDEYDSYWDPSSDHVERLLSRDAGSYDECKERSKVLGEVMELNDGAFSFSDSDPVRYEKLERSAEMFVNYVKNHVSDDDEEDTT